MKRRTTKGGRRSNPEGWVGGGFVSVGLPTLTRTSKHSTIQL